MLSRLLRLAVDVRQGEVATLVWSFGYFFLLLGGYYLLRPLRDEMGVVLGSREFSGLFTAVFVTCLVLVPLYAWVVSRFPRRRVVTIVYRFFVINMIAFFVLWRAGVAPIAVGRVFFVWVGVYSVFTVSVMWSVMADSWSTDQGKRLFGFIAAGGSAGAILGPLASAALAKSVGASTMVLAAAVLLEGATQCMLRLPVLGAAKGPDRAIGGGVFDGLKHVFANRFLLVICLAVLLYGLTSAFLYGRQADILKAMVDDSGDRRRILSLIDTFQNVVGIALQVGVTGRVMAHLGVGAAIAATPLVTFAGFTALLLAPSTLLVAGFQAGRRAVHFAFDRPSREVLFTTVARDDKFKAKNVIDNVAFRGGDVIGAAMYTALGALAAPAALPLALAWLGCALYLARAHARRAHPEGAQP